MSGASKLQALAALAEVGKIGLGLRLISHRTTGASTLHFYFFGHGSLTHLAISSISICGSVFLESICAFHYSPDARPPTALKHCEMRIGQTVYASTFDEMVLGRYQLA